MANLSIGKKKISDGQLIRLVLVGFFGLIALVYLLNSGDILGSRNYSKFETPEMAVVPTIKAIEPDLDDVIIYQGESVVRKLDKGGIQNWTFNGTAEAIVDISIMPSAEIDPNFDPVIELYAPNGDLLIKADDFGANQPELLRGTQLPETGEYTIWVTDKTFEHGATYTLTYTPYLIKATHPQRIGIGAILRGKLTPNQFQMWVFTGAEIQNISLTLLPIREYEVGFQPTAQLYTPTGELLATMDATTGRNILRNIELPSSGNYTLWVMDDGNDNSGEYALSVQQLGRKAELNERR